MKSEDALTLIKVAQGSLDKKADCFVKEAVSPYGAGQVTTASQYTPVNMTQLTNPNVQQGSPFDFESVFTRTVYAILLYLIL